MKSMLKLTLRNIRSSFMRYLAILLIVMLSVGFFSGLKITRDAMAKTGGDYLTEQHFYDYRLISTPDVYAWETAAADRSTVLVSCCVIHTRVQQTLIVKLRGLDENAWYHDPESGNIYSGGMLMHAGLNLSALGLRDRDAVMIRLEKI